MDSGVVVSPLCQQQCTLAGSQGASETGSRPERLPEPTDAARWVSEGGWPVELLLPRTDAGVGWQAAIVAVLFAL